MGCRDQWADDSHLIMNLYVEAPWTWDELMSHVRQVYSMVQAENKPCATTVDVSQIGTLPVGNVLRHLNEIDSIMPENVFASAIIGAPQIVSVFMDIMMRMRPHAQRVGLFAKDHAEAYAKIRERYEQMNQRSITDETPTWPHK